MRAFYHCSAITGFRVWPEGDKSKSLLFIDPCNLTALRKIGKDAYGADTLRLVIDGEEYDIPARRLSEDIAAMLP